MFKSLHFSCSATIVHYLLCSITLLVFATDVSAEIITYQIIPFSGADYLDGTYTDTIGGTITAPTGTYTNTSTTTYLDAAIYMTKTKAGSSPTIFDTYSAYPLSSFVRQGTAYFQADGIYMTTAGSSDLYFNRSHSMGAPVVSFEWYPANNRLIAWAGYQGQGATMKIDSFNAGSVYNYNGTLWKIANAVPEPSALVLLACVFPVLAAAAWKQRKSR